MPASLFIERLNHYRHIIITINKLITASYTRQKKEYFSIVAELLSWNWIALAKFSYKDEILICVRKSNDSRIGNQIQVTYLSPNKGLV